MVNSDPNAEHDPGESSDSARIDLIVEESLDQMQRGDDIDLADINQRYPELQPELARRLVTLQKIFSLVEDSETSGQAETQISPGAFRRELQLHFDCPHCGAGVDVVDRLHDEVTCRNCGSSIQLSANRQQSETASQTVFRREVGRFSLREQVGRGGFGVVFKAWDRELKREVAIKLPRDGYFASDEEEQRFLREARHAARLNHPHIVPVYEIGREEGAPYIVSEFIDGMTLSDLINDRRLDFMESADLLAHVADAVEYAHSNKIVHRDLKPGNILLNHELQPFVADFGLATADEGEFTITLAGQVIGTPSYMSPEQVVGNPEAIGPHSDIYALGVMLYRLLTGELPFRGGKRLLMHQIQHEEPRPPRTLNEFIPIDLETIALKAMSKEPARRYASASDMADDLRRAVRGDPIKARPISRAEKFRRWCRRYPAVASLATAVALLLMITAVGAVTWGVRENVLRKEADDNAASALDNLVRNYVARGNDRVLKTDYLGSLPFLTRAWELESANGEREAIHRLRLGSLLDQCPQLVSVKATDQPVVACKFSPDNRLAGCAAQDGRILVWEIATGRELVSEKIDSAVSRIAFAPDNRFLASGHADGSIRLWDLESDSLVATFGDHQSWIIQLAFDETGRLLSSSNDGFARVREIPGGELVAEFLHEQPAKRARLLQDGKTLIVASWGGRDFSTASWLVLWDLEQPDEPVKRILLPWKVDLLELNESQDMLLAVSRYRENQASQLKLWNLDDMEAEPVTIELDSNCLHAEFLKDRDGILVVDANGQLQTYTVDSGVLASEVDTGIKVACAEVDPAQQLAALGGVGNQVTIWDYAQQTTVCAPLLHANQVLDVAFSVNSRYAMTFGQDGFIKIWDIRPSPNQYVFEDGDHFGQYRLSHSGKLAAVCNQHGRVSLLAMPQGKPTGVVFPHPQDTTVWSCDFGPDDLRLVTSSHDGIARLWDVPTGNKLSEFRASPEHGLLQIRFSADGDRLIASQYRRASDGRPIDTTKPTSAIVWDTATGEEVAKLPHSHFVSRIEPGPQGQYVATIGMDRAVHVWDLQSGERMGQPLHQMINPQFAQDCEFGPWGNQLMTCGGDFNCFVWDFMTGEQLTGPLQHRTSVSHAQFHPHGSTPVTASDDGRILFWGPGSNPELLQVIRTFGTEIEQIGFDAEGQFFFTGSISPAFASQDKRFARAAAQIWDADTGELVGPLFPSLHGIELDGVLFGKSAEFISIADTSGNVITWQLQPEQRSLDQVRDLCEVLSGHRIDDNSSLVPLTADEFMQRWQRLRQKDTAETSSTNYSPLAVLH